MTPMTPTDQLDRGDGTRSISPSAMHQEEARVLMGVDDEERESKRRRVETEREAAEQPDVDDIFEGATWVTANSRWEFEDRMRSMGHEVGSREWREYAREFVRVERDQDEPEVPEPIHGSRDGSATPPEGPDEVFGGDMSAGRDHEPTEEGREVKTSRPAACPSEAEWRAHRVTHYPYRSWCPYCRTARGVAGKHKRGDPETVTGLDFHFDYCFLNNAKSGDIATTLVGTDRDSGGVIAHVVPQKGTAFGI